MPASCRGSSGVPHWCDIAGVQTHQEPIPWASRSRPLHSRGCLGRSIWLPEQPPRLSPIMWSLGRLPRGSSKSSSSLVLLHRGCQNAHPLVEIPSPRDAKPSLGSGARLHSFERLMEQGHLLASSPVLLGAPTGPLLVGWIFPFVAPHSFLPGCVYHEEIPTLPSPMPVQFSRSVLSNSLRLCGLQHASFLCPSPTPRACSNS